MVDQSDFRQLLLAKIKAHGGWTNAHAHFDRAYSVTPKLLSQAHALMEQKWTLVDAMKRSSSEEMYASRIEKAVKRMIAQGVSACATFIDVDPVTEHRALKAAVYVKKKYEKKIRLLLVNQVLKGILDPVARQWAQKALPYVDIIGGLPSRDRPNDEKHLAVLFSWAKETGKRVHVHIDQENSPKEHDTMMLARKTIQWGLEGKVVAVHSISLAAQPKHVRKETYTVMKAAGLSVIVCPSAALSMKPVAGRSEIHNSIGPVVELLEAGIPVALGTDNIADVYQPLVDGDMYTELRFLAEANRFYDIDALTTVASISGRKVLGI